MFYKYFQRLLLGAACAFLGYYFVSHWPSIADLIRQIDLLLFTLSLVLLIAVYFLDAIGWSLILRALGGKHRSRDLVKIWLFSSLSRYIPGVIWAYASRIIASKQIGIPVPVCSASLLLENLLLAVSAFFIGLPSLLYILNAETYIPIIVVLIIMLLGIFFLPSLFGLLRKAPGQFGLFFSQIVCPDRMKIAGLLLYYTLFWLLFSAVFLLFTLSMVGLGESQLWVIASAFAMSFSFGFILIVFPGGLGIREIIMFGALSTILSPEASLALAIGSRIWLVIGEVISFGFALLIKGPCRDAHDR